MRHRTRSFHANPHLLDGALAWLQGREFYCLSMGRHVLMMEVGA